MSSSADRPTPLESKRIGTREVHPIGIGTWGMGGDRLDDGNIFADYRYDEREVEAIRYSIAMGQNHIDTAAVYGAGHTEEIVGQALRGSERERLFVATKVWRSHSLRNAVPHSAEESLKRLGISYLDLLYVHAPWDAIPMNEYIGGLCDAQSAGLTRAIGVSNFTTEQLEEAMALSTYPIVANQVHYSILNHGPVTDRMCEFCRNHGIAIVAYRPVEQRLLADRTEVPVVLDAAAEVGCTPAQLALAWLLAQRGVVAIPKATSPEHIDENLGALLVRLSPPMLRRLDQVSGEKE
jgi:diketogulonate reductase-like aldo/keto reductase